MFGFPLMFWIVPFLLFMMFARHRRWERRAAKGYHYGGPPGLERELEEQRAYVDTLEKRLAEVEERLDFTERLLAGKSTAAS